MVRWNRWLTQKRRVEVMEKIILGVINMNMLEKKSFAGDKSTYIEYLSKKREWNDKLYTDPDATHVWGEDKKNMFYRWLVKYLNVMEKNCLDGKWKYSVVGASEDNKTPSGIKVSTGNEKDIFLRSDQFGFSAPRGKNKEKAWDSRYPYGKYLTSTNEYDFVADVIWDTRSQGGSFIWPIVKTESKGKTVWKSQYNINRGVRSYIEDRVDITLWEIKKFYDSWKQVKQNGNGEVNKENLIHKMKEDGLVLLSGNDSDLIIDWLTHFESFDKYIKFFSFESFLKKGTDNIINLVTGEELTVDYILDVHDNINNRIVSIQDMNVLKGMLKRLQCQTNDRTDQMIKKVRGTQ